MYLMSDTDFLRECKDQGIVYKNGVYVQQDDQVDLLGSDDTSFIIGGREETEMYLLEVRA